MTQRTDWECFYLVHPEFEAVLAVGHPGATESPVYSFVEHGEEDLKWTLLHCGLVDAAPRVVST